MAAFGGFDDVAEQHGDGGRTDPTDPRSDGARHVLTTLVDVGQQATTLVADTGADHRDARL